MWKGTTYGNGWMHRRLVSFLRHVDLRVIYAFAAVFVVPVVLMVNPASRTPIYRMYRRRFGLGPMKAFLFTVRNHYAFATCVIDKFAMYAGKKFDITISGYEIYREAARKDDPFIILSSHTGNYEIAGYSLKADKKRFNAVVYGAEKKSVMDSRRRMFDDNNIRMIEVVPGDMGHLFLINEAFCNGEVVSFPGDRVFGSGRSFTVTFLGAEAQLPQGPFRTAVSRGCEVLFVSVIKTAVRKYRITVTALDRDDRNTKRSDMPLVLAQQYSALLEGVVRENPLQWFNFYYFWKKDETV